MKDLVEWDDEVVTVRTLTVEQIMGTVLTYIESDGNDEPETAPTSRSIHEARLAMKKLI